MNNIEEYEYRIAKTKMSKNKLADLMYAAIMTRSGLPNSFGIGIYNLTRSQNTYNLVDVNVHIHPSKIEQFEEISGVSLREHEIVTAQ